MSILVEDGRVSWIRPSDDEGPRRRPGWCRDRRRLRVHDHPRHGGRPQPPHHARRRPLDRARRGSDRATARRRRGQRPSAHLGRRPLGARRGIGPARPIQARTATSARWRSGSATGGGGSRGYPHVRAAGTWIMATGTLPGLSVEAADADELLAAALAQLDDGADLVKLYLDGPDPAVSPWTAGELGRVVRAVHARGARVTAHSGYLAGARAGAEAGVDALEHGFELDETTAGTMAANGVRLVSTLCVLASWQTFGRTTTLPRFASGDGSGEGRGTPRGRAGVGEAGPSRGGLHRHRDRLRRRLHPRQPAGLGGRAARRGRARAVGGARIGHLAWGRAPGRARRRRAA